MQNISQKSPILEINNKSTCKQDEPQVFEPMFRATLTRHKKHKPYDIADRRNSISLGEGRSQKEGSFCSKQTYKQKLAKKGAQNKEKPSKQSHAPQFLTKKQTFKQFLRKIQMYNKNKIIHEFQLAHQTPPNSQINIHHSQICIQSLNKSSLPDQLSLQMIEKEHKNQTSLHNYVEKSSFQVEAKMIERRPRIKNKSKQFVIHQSPSKCQWSRDYKRSKTEQDIKFEAKEEDMFEVVGQKNATPNDKKTLPNFKTFYVTNSKQPLSHVSLKLIQHPIPQHRTHLTNTEQRLNTVDSSTGLTRIKDKDLNKHKKLLETKYSKIRIRFGSSLYNKNLWRFDGRLKQSMRKQLESIVTEDLIALKYHHKDKKPSINSIFCEHKIIEAQNAFIQKRRLLPANGTDEREDPSKTNKRFFSVAKSLKRQKTLEFEGKAEKSKKGQNLNGWEVSDEGLQNDKIEQFF